MECSVITHSLTKPLCFFGSHYNCLLILFIFKSCTHNLVLGIGVHADVLLHESVATRQVHYDMFISFLLLEHSMIEVVRLKA